MQDEWQMIDEWIPEQMEPGTMFVLQNPRFMGDAHNPYVAVLACPGCGSLGLITRSQYFGSQSMICGSDDCSAEYFLRDDQIEFRKPH